MPNRDTIQKREAARADRTAEAEAPRRESGPRDFQGCEDFGAVLFGRREVCATVFAFFAVNGSELFAVRAKRSHRPFLDAQERQEPGEAAEQMEHRPTQSRPDVKVVAPGQP